MERNWWLIIGINTRTGKREVIHETLTRETALCHKMDLQNERPLRYAGISIEYGTRKEYAEELLPGEEPKQ